MPRVPPSFQLPSYPEHHQALTDDGWQLSLYRYPAFFRGRVPGLNVAPGDRTPLILSHGLACNHWTWDLGEDRSLARYLADRGFDVWMIELRGHGDSRPPQGWTGDVDGWGIDEYSRLDVPAAIRHVRAVTGAPQVSWIGHSMGGMIIYEYLSSTGDPSVRNVVTLGSPGSVDFPNATIAAGLQAAPLAYKLERVPSRGLARGWALISGRVPGGFEETIWHLPNMAPDAARLMMWTGLADMERGVLKSLAEIAEQGKLVSRDGRFDYQARLDRFQAPLLAVAGKLDGLAPPHTVRQVYDRVGSTDKTYVMIGRANGFSFDYGHVDLIIGDRSKVDVFPLVYGWLEARQPGEAWGGPAATERTVRAAGGS